MDANRLEVIVNFRSSVKSTCCGNEDSGCTSDGVDSAIPKPQHSRSWNGIATDSSTNAHTRTRLLYE